MASTGIERDNEIVAAVLERAVGDLMLILDRKLAVGEASCERSRTKAVAGDGIQLSFRQRYQVNDEVLEGCILVPLADAIALGGFLQGLEDEEIEARKGLDKLDPAGQAAMIELAGFLAGSIESAIRSTTGEKGHAVESAGCQGVPAAARPNFVFSDGQELIVARADVTLMDEAGFPLLAMLPGLLSAAA